VRHFDAVTTKFIWIALILLAVVAVVYALLRSRRQGSGEHYHLVKMMTQQPGGSWSEPVLHADIASFIGKSLVIAVRYPNGGIQTLVHFFGPIVRISEGDGIVISRSDGRGDFAVPPRAFLVEEHQRETRPTSMTEVIRPDYSTLIDVEGPPREHGWSRILDRHNAQ
jgi:hypothetical protein